MQVSFHDFCVGYGTGMTAGARIGGDEEPNHDPSVQTLNDIHIVSDEMYTPNELSASPDGKFLYSGRMHYWLAV